MLEYNFERSVLVCLHALGVSVTTWSQFKVVWTRTLLYILYVALALTKKNVKYIQEYKRVTLLSKTL